MKNSKSDATAITNAIKRKVAARQVMLELVVDFIPGLLGLCDEGHFWKLMAEHCAKKAGLSVTPLCLNTAMTDNESMQFEKSEVPFGKHKGVPVGRVDPEYLASVCESEFNQQLRRYFASAYYRKKHQLPG